MCIIVVYCGAVSWRSYGTVSWGWLECEASDRRTLAKTKVDIDIAYSGLERVLVSGV